MKNTSARNYRNNVPVIVLLLVTAITLQAQTPDRYGVTEQRGDFFLVRLPRLSECPQPGAKGNVYATSGHQPVGTCRVLAIHTAENTILCRLETLKSDSEDMEIRGVSFTTTTAVRELTLKILNRKVRFAPLKDFPDHFLNLSPIPLTQLTSPDLSGIKSILFQIESDTGRQYAANLIDSSQILPMGLNRQLNFSHPGILLLGIHEGKLSMLHDDAGAIQHTPMTANTLKSFKKDIYFHILLKRKNADQSDESDR